MKNQLEAFLIGIKDIGLPFEVKELAEGKVVEIKSPLNASVAFYFDKDGAYDTRGGEHPEDDKPTRQTRR